MTTWNLGGICSRDSVDSFVKSKVLYKKNNSLITYKFKEKMEELYSMQKAGCFRKLVLYFIRWLRPDKEYEKIVKDVFSDDTKRKVRLYYEKCVDEFRSSLVSKSCRILQDSTCCGSFTRLIKNLKKLKHNVKHIEAPLIEFQYISCKKIDNNVEILSLMEDLKKLEEESNFEELIKTKDKQLYVSILELKKRNLSILEKFMLNRAIIKRKRDLANQYGMLNIRNAIDNLNIKKQELENVVMKRPELAKLQDCIKILRMNIREYENEIIKEARNIQMKELLKQHSGGIFCFSKIGSNQEKQIREFLPNNYQYVVNGNGKAMVAWDKNQFELSDKGIIEKSNKYIIARIRIKGTQKNVAVASGFLSASHPLYYDPKNIKDENGNKQIRQIIANLKKARGMHMHVLGIGTNRMLCNHNGADFLNSRFITNSDSNPTTIHSIYGVPMKLDYCFVKFNGWLNWLLSFFSSILTSRVAITKFLQDPEAKKLPVTGHYPTSMIINAK